jgi:hypothetical protein
MSWLGEVPAIHVDPQEPQQLVSLALSVVMVGEGRPSTSLAAAKTA